jgi:hypothetical protein
MMHGRLGWRRVPLASRRLRNNGKVQVHTPTGVDAASDHPAPPNNTQILRHERVGSPGGQYGSALGVAGGVPKGV